jgi:type III restriction enzyme
MADRESSPTGNQTTGPAGYLVDRVVICDAYREPDQHYRLLSGGRSKLQNGRRPSIRFLASAKATKGGIAGLVGKQAGLFEDQLAADEQLNETVNALRDDVKAWRLAGYPGTSAITRRLLEWWFERDEERQREHTRFFFCQQEAVETLIYLYEVRRGYRMPGTDEFLRYALKLATGTGKTIVMALVIVWSSLHRARVLGSSLSANFLVLVPNLTVRDRVWGTDLRTGQPTGAGLDPNSSENLYRSFDIVPPEYRSDFKPNILVRNWQSIPLEVDRDDWLKDEALSEGRFVPASVLWAVRRRQRQQADPRAAVRRFLGGWKDLIVINDEAHHAWGEKRNGKDGELGWIVWSQILSRLSQSATVPLVLDMSATPWYPSGSLKPEGTLFEWLVSDFSVYDAFESGLVKVVRLPDPDEAGHRYLDLWDLVKGARTKEEYLSACRGAIASIYASWRKEFDEWQGQLAWELRGPSPVMLLVADRAERARWLFEHLTSDYELLRNEASDDPSDWVTIQVDSRVFDAEKGNEATLREMVNTVGRPGKAGERVRCIVSVNMLSEGWDVKNVSHILGLRAFGSPLLTEQVIGRGLRRVDYSAINVPIEERRANPNRPDEETVDAFGIPFVGFPVERRKRPAVGGWSVKATPIAPDARKERFALTIPNVRSWAVGVSKPLVDSIAVGSLPGIVIDPRDTPPDVQVRPVVGGGPESIMTLDEFRREYPLLRTCFMLAKELHDSVAAESGGIMTGPTFEEVLAFVTRYVEERVEAIPRSVVDDLGIYYWRQQAFDIIGTAIHDAPSDMITVPIYGEPPFLETRSVPEFKWPGLVAAGLRTNWSGVPCHSPLEGSFADFLDGASDVVRYVKNERLGFSLTFHEGNRPRQYFPDFIAVVKHENQERWWLVETKGEEHPNTVLKSEAARLWCDRMTRSGSGIWAFLFVPERPFEASLRAGTQDFADLVGRLAARDASLAERQAAERPPGYGLGFGERE